MAVLQISTTRFGEVQVDESKVINFVSPVLGFETLKKFVILDHTDNSPFKWLQSIEDAEVAFVVTNPKFFGIPYEFALPETLVKQLDIKAAEDVLVFTIVNIPDNPVGITANLLAPLVLNQISMKGLQFVLQDPELSISTPLMSQHEEESKSASAAAPSPAKEG